MREKIELIILENAQFELETIALMHLELVGARSAQGITDRIYTALQRLCVHPRLGRQVEERGLAQLGYRKLICGNYLCFYRQMEKIIYVYHIVDGRTDYPKLLADLPRTPPE